MRYFVHRSLNNQKFIKISLLIHAIVMNSIHIYLHSIRYENSLFVLQIIIDTLHKSCSCLDYKKVHLKKSILFAFSESIPTMIKSSNALE